MKNNVKVIFHIDMNAFFTSCEQIHNPKLQNKPIAISGKNAIYNKGVILTASYEARKFGVKSAMPVFQAKELCPQLILVPSNHSLYQDYSRKFFSLLKEYTNKIEIGSIDEAYMDITSLITTKHPLTLAKEIQDRLFHEIGLPTSIGIASNKFLAKMASDFKKPMGISVLRRREIKTLLWPLPIKEMFGIGKKTAPKLVDAGILTIGDLVKKDKKVVAQAILGNQYDHFYQCALGYGDDHVDPSKNDSYKSVGHSETYSVFIIDEKVALQHLEKLTEMVLNRLHRYRYLTKTITIQIRDDHFKTHSKSLTIKDYTNQFDKIYPVVIDLFDELWDRKPIRLLGVSTSNLIEKQEYKEEYNLFNYQDHIEDESLIKTVHQINRKFGSTMIKRGIKLKK